MAVKFEFIVSDVDAENIMSILRAEVWRSQTEAKLAGRSGLSEADQATASWHQRHADYLQTLCDTISSSTTRA